MKVSQSILYVLLTAFLIGFVGTIAKWPRPVIAAVTYIYCIVLTILVGFLLAAVWSNNHRLKKVMKILGVTKQEYNQLAEKYYP